MQPNLTPEQRAALIEFKKEHGRCWRAALRRLWHSGKDQQELRQIRNQFADQLHKIVI